MSNTAFYVDRDRICEISYANRTALNYVKCQKVSDVHGTFFWVPSRISVSCAYDDVEVAWQEAYRYIANEIEDTEAALSRLRQALEKLVNNRGKYRRERRGDA